MAKAYLSARKARWLGFKAGWDKALSLGKEALCLALLATCAVVFLWGCVELPKQVAVWTFYAGHRLFGTESGAGELAYSAGDTMENEARWRAAVAGVSSEDWRRDLDSAWSRAASKARESKNPDLWLSKEYVDALLKLGSNASVKRKEAVLASLVESLARGDDELEALRVAKEVARSFGSGSKNDSARGVESMMGAPLLCSGAALSQSLVVGVAEEGACRGLESSAPFVYWLLGIGLICVAGLFALVAKAAWGAWAQSLGEWAFERKGELLARWEAEQMASVAKSEKSGEAKPGRSKRI
jgi:hypothetical protein